MFDRGAGYWGYTDAVRRIVHGFKYTGRRDLLAPLGRRMAQDPRIGSWLAASRDAVIVPLPARPAARRRRGYDQACLLAESLAQAARRPYLARALVRRKNSARAQAGSSLAQRRAQVRAAFRSRRWYVAGCPVVLVDDVISTGASADAAARALLLAGARDVTLVALAT